MFNNWKKQPEGENPTPKDEVKTTKPKGQNSTYKLLFTAINVKPSFKLTRPDLKNAQANIEETKDIRTDLGRKKK